MDRRIEIHSSPRTPMPLSQQEMIEDFWRKKQVEIEEIQDFGDRAIPMTRIKKVICDEKGKMMMAFDTPSFLTKACEIFVQEIALRAWISANSQQRSIILDSDIAEAIASTQSHDFLNDVLNAHQDEHRSCPDPKPTKKRHDRLLTNLPSSSRHLPPHQNQLPQFSHRFTRYPPLFHIPPPAPQTNGHGIPLPLASLPHEASSIIAITGTPTPVVSGIIPPTTNYMANDLGSFGNTINNIATSGVMNHLKELPRALSNIPNVYRYMNMVASTSVYGVDGPRSSNVAAQDSGVAFHRPYIPQIILQLPSPLQTEITTSAHNGTNITIENYIDVEVAATKSTIHASSTTNGNGDIDSSAIGVGDDQHQHEEEANTSLEVNGVHGSLDAQAAAADADDDDAAAAANMGNDINWDELDMLDDSLLSVVGKDIIMDEEPTPLPNTASNDDLLLASNISDLKGFSHEPYLLDDIITSAGTSKRCT